MNDEIQDTGAAGIVMMARKTFLLLLPLFLSLAISVLIAVSGGKSAVSRGVLWGLWVALAQTYVSIGLLKWAWEKKFFYFVWGGGFLFRLFVFVLTAFVVYRYTELSLAATLLSLVAASTLFLVFESAAYLKEK